MKQTQPIRMCVSCRNRETQQSLIRFKLEEKEVIAYNGYGRSFYLCSVCSKNQKKIKGVAKRFGINTEQFLKLLQELTDNG